MTVVDIYILCHIRHLSSQYYSYHFSYIYPYAACKLVYLGSVEVLEPGDGESVVRETVEQLKTSGPLTTSVVTFKASMDGITITHDISG